MPGIQSLQQTSADVWVAQYQGTQGTYTVELKFRDNKLHTHSCSCPGWQLPCKHIGIVLDAVGQQAPVDVVSFSRTPYLTRDVVYIKVRREPEQP